MSNSAVLIILAALFFLIIVGLFDKLHNDLLQINKTLNNIAKHSGIQNEYLDELNVELEELVEQGKNIEAVKKYRKATGVNLKEANDYVTGLINRKK